MNISNILNKISFFKGKKKSTQIIGIIALVLIALFVSSNDKAQSLLTKIRQTAEVIAGTELTPEENEMAPSSSPASSSDSSSSSVFPSLTPNYSTTNSENLWLEIRQGFADGDEAADHEIRERARQRLEQ
ncbi:MAG: hypothetical protein FWD40_09290 [Treponema sp.]|nr:hypothetical protein [Treponema sp.]